VSRLLFLDPGDVRWRALLALPEACTFHHPAWIEALHATYGYRAFVAAVPDGAGGVSAGLPIMEVNSLLTGRRWVALPFSDHCCPLAADAAAISKARHTAADDLAAQVKDELAALAMPHAELRFDVTDAALGPHGADRIELLFTANPGSEPAPLAKVASGGELSRVRLALEVVLADAGAHHTYVFDEVDAGVGGSAALDLGARLARLAETAQVIVVTHLGQVAAFADRHHVVHKSSDGAITASDVRSVEGPDRVAEIARMLGGVTDSQAALDHARELLEEHAPQRLAR